MVKILLVHKIQADSSLFKAKFHSKPNQLSQNIFFIIFLMSLPYTSSS